MGKDRAAIMKWFGGDHLPEGPARVVSTMIARDAADLESLLPENDQGNAALFFLLQAKDAAVRAVLDDSVPDYR